VELYTSEGCSSCPSADARLGALGRAAQSPKASPGLAALNPMALHVEYWDSLGWKDALAQPAFTQRQKWLTRANGHTTIYTPAFFVNGMELRDDSPGGLERAIDAQSRLPSQATLRLHSDTLVDGRVQVSVQASLLKPDAQARQLVVLLTESGLVSRVSAGENSGATLRHDHVARNWYGPWALSESTPSASHTLDIQPPGSRRIGVLAFVQDPRTGEVLQSVSTLRCAAL